MITVTSDPADAATRRRRAAVTTSGPNYSAIVVDANSGNVLHAASPDAIRHPASLTKIMTLFMLFERLEAGTITLETRLRVSEHASEQSPTKLGLSEGTTISVEDAIKGMITRSANDAAVVVAENLAVSEEEFARQMTRKARALGMTRTVYRNASGLPDSEQVTTARDQAILGRAIQERFPRYYRYFSIRSFTFRGRQIANHNRLLGRVEGVDGIKTGYTRASGFNLVTSLRRDGRYVVAVVMGGTSAGARDARMRQLLAQHVDSASTRRAAPVIAETPSRDARPDARSNERFEMASAASAPTAPPAASRPAQIAGTADPIRPVAVRTVSVRPAAGTKTASVAAMSPVAEPAEAEPPTAPAVDAPAPPARASALGYLPVRPAPAAEPDVQAAPPTVPAATPVRETSSIPSSAPPPTRSGWIIQVGAYPAESEAHQQIASVRSKASRFLASASPFTEPVQRGSTTYYRARFAGLDRTQAEAACRFLRSNEIDCLAMRN
jgi:D-alanyl-D-alanine carboxypeptidase